MSISSVHHYRGFCICAGATTKDFPKSSPNKGIGNYNAWFYGLSGEGYLINPDTEDKIPLHKGILLDTSAFKDKELHFVCESDSAIWAAFNPTTEKYNLNVQSYESGEYELHNPEYDLIIVPCVGTATVNQTTLDTFKSARLPKGKTATLNVPPSTLCAVVYLYPVNQE